MTYLNQKLILRTCKAHSQIFPFPVVGVRYSQY